MRWRPDNTRRWANPADLPAQVPTKFETSPSLREADTVQKLLESSVGPQRIKGRSQQDGRVESRVITLVQPDHCLIQITETHMDQGDVGFGRTRSPSWRTRASIRSCASWCAPPRTFAPAPRRTRRTCRCSLT